MLYFTVLFAWDVCDQTASWWFWQYTGDVGASLVRSSGGSHFHIALRWAMILKCLLIRYSTVLEILRGVIITTYYYPDPSISIYFVGDSDPLWEAPEPDHPGPRSLTLRSCRVWRWCQQWWALWSSCWPSSSPGRCFWSDALQKKTIGLHRSGVLCTTYMHTCACIYIYTYTYIYIYGDRSKGPCKESCMLCWKPSRKFFSSSRKKNFISRKFRESWVL